MTRETARDRSTTHALPTATSTMRTGSPALQDRVGFTMPDTGRHASDTPEKIIPRPSTGWAGLMASGLGDRHGDVAPLPSSQENVRHHTFAAFVVMVAAIAAFIGTNRIIGASTPFSRPWPSAGGSLSPWIVLIVGAVGTLLLVALAVLLCTSYDSSFFTSLRNDITYRYGAETWTLGQKIRSVVQCAVLSPILLIVLSLLAGPGFAAMAVVESAASMLIYLHDAKSTGDPGAATFSAAHFATRMNLSFAICLPVLTAVLSVALFVQAISS